MAIQCWQSPLASKEDINMFHTYVTRPMEPVQSVCGPQVHCKAVSEAGDTEISEQACMSLTNAGAGTEALTVHSDHSTGDFGFCLVLDFTTARLPSSTRQNSMLAAIQCTESCFPFCCLRFGEGRW